LDSINILDSLVNTTKESNLSKTFLYAKQALALGKRDKDPEALARAYILMGIAYTKKRNDSSYFYYSEALRFIEKSGLPGLKPSLFYNFSTLYNAAHDYKSMEVLLDSAIRLAAKESNYFVLSNAYNSLGNLKYELHDDPGAKCMFDSSYTISARKGLFEQMGISLGNLALFEPNIQKSVQIQKQAIGLLQKSKGSEEAIAMILVNIGLRQISPDSAIKYFKLALNDIGSAGSDEVKIGAFNNLAYSYLDKKDFYNAKICLIAEAIPLAEKDSNFDWMSTLYDSYADVLKTQGNLVDGLIYEKKAFKYRQEADKIQASDQVRLLGVLLEVKNKELTIQAYQQENQNKDNRIQKIKLFFVSFLFLTGAVVFILLLIAQRNKLKLQKQLVTSAKKIIDAEENLKGRIASELHDMITPMYSQLLQQIETTDISGDELKEDLHTKLSVLANRIRQISHRMNKVFIEQVTFFELVRGACDDMQYMTDIPIKLEISEETIELTSETATHSFRIIQELLSNAVKYVKEGTINLSVSVALENLYIIYKDHGPGFDAYKSPNNGIGVMNIMERAKLIGGEATLTTAPGHGTHWRICIPLGSLY